MITTRYYCRIEYGIPKGKEYWEVDNSCDDELWDLSRTLNIEDFTTVSGTPASAPYLEFWSEKREVVAEAQRKFIELFRKHNYQVIF